MLYIAICINNNKDRTSISRVIINYFSQKKIYFKISVFENEMDLVSSSKKFDLIIIDLLNGQEKKISILKKYLLNYNISNYPLIVVLSDTINFYLDGFEIKAFRYFVKPISEKNIDAMLGDAIKELMFEKLYIRCDSMIGVELYLKNIIFAEVNNRKVLFYTEQDCIKSSSNFQFWYAVLKPYGFVQIYKGIIVNIKYVMKFNFNTIYLSNGKTLPLSRTYHRKFVDTFEQKLKENSNEISSKYLNLK